jgi:hypothetical protein
MRTAPAADFMGCSGAARQEERHEQHGTQHDRRLAHQRAAVQHAEQRREPEPEPGPSRRRLAEQLAHAFPDQDAVLQRERRGGYHRPVAAPREVQRETRRRRGERVKAGCLLLAESVSRIR